MLKCYYDHRIDKQTKKKMKKMDIRKAVLTEMDRIKVQELGLDLMEDIIPNVTGSYQCIR